MKLSIFHRQSDGGPVSCPCKTHDPLKPLRRWESRNMPGICRMTRQLLVLAAFLATPLAFAQNRVDLDDLNIKGELLNDNRMRLSARDQHQISDRVSYRTNYRREITDGLEINWPEAEREPSSEKTGGGQ